MNSPFLGLRTAAYKVPDLEEAKQWYTEVFGVSPYFDEPFYVGFNIGGFELGLQPYDHPNMQSGDTVVTYWGVMNIQKEYDRLLNLGASVHENPQNVGGEIVVASVRDPWNNIIGIIYNPHFKLED